MKNLKKGDWIQISRRGYYICDREFKALSPNTTKYAILKLQISIIFIFLSKKNFLLILCFRDGVLEGEPCVLFYIPEGNKNESPTSYMSLTNQKYFTVTVAEANEAKPKVSKDNNKENKPSVLNSGSNVLYEKVKTQAELVRTIKANKAPKDEVTKQVNILLVLKEEYKKETGQEWKLIENVQQTTVSVQVS